MPIVGSFAEFVAPPTQTFLGLSRICGTNRVGDPKQDLGCKKFFLDKRVLLQ